MGQKNGSHPTGIRLQTGSLKALLLSLTLGVLGVFLLLSILGAGAVVSASPGEHTLNNLKRRISDSAAALAATSVYVTKTVEPPDPDTGGEVSICFTISGLGPMRLDVVLAQDVSESMNGPAGEGTPQTRLEASQAAASAFVSFLPITDRIAVVPYSTTAYLAQPLTTTKSVITSTIYGLTARGETNIGEGIRVSHRELITSPRYMPDTIKTIILLSDGRANRPGNEETAEAYARQRAEAAASHNIKIYTVGFGADADEELLQSIADIGNGRYFFAPDSDVLEAIYLTIALELHNVVITDLLVPGVETDCSQWPEGWCVVGPSGVTTITWPIGDSSLISDPAVFCFTATANLDPNYEGPVNLPGSGICYQDSDGQTVCEEFDNPTVSVGGRKITGHVFYDVNTNGQRDAGETGVADIMVRTSTDVTTTTDVSGSYVLRTSSEPAISVTFEVPPGYDTTTPISHHIPPITGTYPGRDFGIYGSVCVQGKVFDDVNANGQDDEEEGLAGATVIVSSGTATTTGSSGTFSVCAPVNAGQVTIIETDPPGYTSTAAINGPGVRVVDANTLRIDNPEPGRVYGGNKFGDTRLPAMLAIAKKSSSQWVATNDVLRYTLTYTNVGGAVAHNLRLTDSLPTGLVYQHPASLPPVTHTADNELVWDLPPLEPAGEGEIIVITVTVKPSAPGQVLTNCVELKSDESHASTCTPVYTKWSLYFPVVAKNHPLPIIINGSFEEGWTGWVHGGRLSQSISPDFSRSGNFAALLGNPTYRCENGVPVGSAWVEQTFIVPDTAQPKLFFWYRIFTQDKNPANSAEFDSFDVKINGDLVFRDSNKTGPYGCAPHAGIDLGWQPEEIDLSHYRGQQITIRFENRSHPDEWFNTWTFVDDVQFLP